MPGLVRENPIVPRPGIDCRVGKRGLWSNDHGANGHEYAPRSPPFSYYVLHCTHLANSPKVGGQDVFFFLVNARDEFVCALVVPVLP